MGLPEIAGWYIGIGVLVALGFLWDERRLIPPQFGGLGVTVVQTHTPRHLWHRMVDRHPLEMVWHGLLWALVWPGLVGLYAFILWKSR